MRRYVVQALASKFKCRMYVRFLNKLQESYVHRGTHIGIRDTKYVFCSLQRHQSSGSTTFLLVFERRKNEQTYYYACVTRFQSLEDHKAAERHEERKNSNLIMEGRSGDTVSLSLTMVTYHLQTSMTLVLKFFVCR